MSKLSHIIILVLCFFLIFNSCQKHQLEISGWSPELVSPIVNATITIADLIPERGTTEYDKNNLIHLAFRSDSIYVLPSSLIQDITGLNIDTVITLEALVVSAQSDPAVAALINASGIQVPFPASQEIPGVVFNFLNADILDPFNFQFDEFSDATFNSGQLEISITNNLPVAIETVEIKLIPAEGIEWEVDINQLDSGEEFTHSIDLSGLVIESSNNITLIIETLQIENVGADMVELTPQTGFDVFFNINNVGFDNITLPLGGDTVDVDLALFEDFDSGLILEDPRFTLNVNNPFSLSGSINGNLFAFSQEGVEESLTVDLDIQPNNLSSITYFREQIGDIIALPPQLLAYEAHASLSFNATDIIGSESLMLGVDIDFPLSVNAANLSLKDTVVFEGINYDLAQINRMLLHYNLINGFPLGTEFNLVLHDSLNPGINLDTLEFVDINNNFSNVINPADVDEFGEVIAPVTSSGVLTLSELEIDNLLNTNKLIIDVTLSSSGFQNKDQYVKIYSHHECLFKVGLETEININ